MSEGGSVERRNPYLILGVPFGASREEATRAFLRRTKSLRRLGAAGHALHTDLTGALKEIEDRPEPPDAAMAPYRVPADPTLERGMGTGVFSPPPETLPPDVVPPDLDDLRAAAAHEYLRHLVRLRAQRLGVPAP
jgi:hypothetical protein